MTITHLLNQTIVVQRLREIAGTDTMEFYTAVSNLACHIQPNSDKKSGLAEGVYSKQYVIYLDTSTSIKEGDRVICTDGTLFTVVSGGVTNYNFGSIDFLKVVVEKTV